MRKSLYFLLLLIASILTSACCTHPPPPLPGTAERPLRIVCIGDAITQGGRTNRMEYTYRWPLFCMLKDAKINFDFIGSRQKGLHPNAIWHNYNGEVFDPDHEGVYGIKTANALKNLRCAIPKWSAPPDIALIHLGTNDQKAKDYTVAIIDPLREMIELLRKNNPHMVILLGHLNFNNGTALKIRPLIDALAQEMNTQKSPVLTVNHFEGWNEKPHLPDSDTFDWVHPNRKGQKKMAVKWFQAMQPWLKSSF